MGMDWHSSGITTSVMCALKRGLNGRAPTNWAFTSAADAASNRATLQTSLLLQADRNGLDGRSSVRASRLTAKVDNNAIADGFQIYLHNFVLTDTGEWAVIQQGMNDPDQARQPLSLAFGSRPRFRLRTPHRHRGRETKARSSTWLTGAPEARRMRCSQLAASRPSARLAEVRSSRDAAPSRCSGRRMST